jgi:uncharacterized repeat protein (TIGR03847 family)
MSSSFDLTNVDRFTAGTVGPTGKRVFYLQATGEGEIVTLRLEKQQVAALAEYLAGILDDLPEMTGPTPEASGELVEPVIAEWVVGSLGVAWDETADRVVLVAEELVPVAETDEDAGMGLEVDEEPELPLVDAATARFRLTRGQVASFVVTARDLVAAGRPPCPICGRPLNPEGHICPRSNGHGTDT